MAHCSWLLPICEEDFSDVWDPLSLRFSTSELFHYYEQSRSQAPPVVGITFTPTHGAALRDSAQRQDWGGYSRGHDDA